MGEYGAEPPPDFGSTKTVWTCDGWIDDLNEKGVCNLRDGDRVVHLRAIFRRPASWSPKTHGVFRFGGIGGLEVFAPYAEIVDVELPSLAVGDRVVTPDGKYGTVVAFNIEMPHLERVWIDTGEDGNGRSVASLYVAKELTRDDRKPDVNISWPHNWSNSRV